MNKLYFGDNTELLDQVPDRSIDLIYLDPPFNSQAQYNVLFQSPKEDVETAQAQAFKDTWTWGEEAEWSYKEIMKLGGGTARFIDALRSALSESDMMAYLVMMAIRLFPSYKSSPLRSGSKGSDHCYHPWSICRRPRFLGAGVLQSRC